MEAIVETLFAHQLVYRFLSDVFYEPPNKTFIDTLAADGLFEAFPLETEEAEAQSGLMLLQQFCASWNEADFEALQHDYRKLFVGPGHLLAAPWESVYRNPDALLFDLHTMQVRRVYQRFSMPIPHLYSEPDDHLGLELRLIAHLCLLGLEAHKNQQFDTLTVIVENIHSFLQEHLLQWAPNCLQLVIDHAASDYYRGCAHLVLGCLAHTNEVLRIENLKAVMN